MTALYVPPTEESDHKKQNMSLQLIGGQTSTNTTNITQNTTDIATATAAIAVLNAATYVNSIAGNQGAFTLSHGLTNSANDIQLSLTNATAQASPSNPTGTASATGVMMGLGSSCVITPIYSTRVFMQFQGGIGNSGAGVSGSVGARFGTSTAPANAAATTGTAIGSVVTLNSVTAGGKSPFVVGGIITGLTPGTAYWFDLSVIAGAGTETVNNISFSAFEF